MLFWIWLLMTRFVLVLHKNRSTSNSCSYILHSFQNVIIRLQDSKIELPGFNIFGQQVTSNLLLCIQQLNDVKDVELDFTLAYKRTQESAISGSFTLTLVPEHVFNLNFWILSVFFIFCFSHYSWFHPPGLLFISHLTNSAVLHSACKCICRLAKI